MQTITKTTLLGAFLVGTLFLILWYIPEPSVATPTPQGVASPIMEPRLSYVQDKLIQAGFSESSVNLLLDDGRRTIYPASTVAYKPPDWSRIRQKLYAATYVREGKNFVAKNREIFSKAQQQYGVPGEIITGIIAIETEFGRNTGSTPTFNAIYSRLEQAASTSWKLSAERLVALSRYCLEERLDCYDIKGSYAGAIGIVQFMPDSLMNYGVDGNGDGFIDLQTAQDAIPSAANFLKAHGWQEDKKKALSRYYGSSVGYPDIVLRYATLVAQ